MNVTVVVGTFGDYHRDLAMARAIPSAATQAPVVHVHSDHAGDYPELLRDVRNDGALQSNTEWLCFLDADDELAPGYFDAMDQADGDLRTPAVQYMRRGILDPPKFWPECDLYDGNWMVIGTLVRRELFWRVGGFRPWLLYEDWCLWQRCVQAGATIVKVPDAVYRAYITRSTIHRNGTTKDQKQQAFNEIRRTNYARVP